MTCDNTLSRSTVGEDEQLADLLGQLVELRQAVAQTLGRQQFLYDVVDRAVESGHLPQAQAAIDEFGLQPEDVRHRVKSALCR